MAIDTTTGTTATAASWAGASPTSAQPLTSAALLNALAGGASLEARLVAVLADGSAKLATRLGAFTAKTDGGAQLPPIGTQLTVRVDARAAADGEPLLILRQPTGQTGDAPRPDAAARAPAEIVGRAVAAALARQEGLGASLAAVERLMASGVRLPPEVAAAADRLLKLRLPLDKPPSAKALAAAMRASGIFLEADLARAEAPVAGDLKAALTALRTALAGMPAPTAAIPGRADPAGTAAPNVTGPPSAAAPAAAVPAAPAVPSPTQQPPAVAAPAASPLAAPAPPSAPVAGEAAAAPRLGLLSLQELPETAPAPRADPFLTGGHAAPPLRGRWPEPEADRPLPASAADAADPVGRARAGTEAALARLVLDQVASLVDDANADRARPAASGNPPERSGPQWSFDVPVLLDGRTGSLRFQVERDGGEHRDGQPERRRQSWRLRLAFAMEPLGAIRAQVGLVGERVAVGIWAERPATLAALTAHAGELRDALVAAAFDVDDIHLAAGLPPDSERRSGGRAMLDATA